MPEFPKPITKIEDACEVSTDDLIASYRGSIDMLRAALVKEIEAHKAVEKADSNFGDDIYLLRFVLSHHKKGFEAAKTALVETMAYRAKHAEALYKIRVEGLAPPGDAVFRPFVPCMPHFRNKKGHFIYLIRNGCTNGPLALEAIRGPEITMWMTLSKEFLHAKCDEETRSLKRLIKVIYLMDFTHGTMTGYRGEFKEAMTNASKESELIYPQFLFRTVLYNMPYVISSVLSFVLQFFAKSITEKLLVCDETDPEKMCNWTRKHLDISGADVPEYLGGKCSCVGGCIRGFPNTMPNALTREDVDAIRPKVGSWLLFKSKCEERRLADKLVERLDAGKSIERKDKSEKKDKADKKEKKESKKEANEAAKVEETTA